MTNPLNPFKLFYESLPANKQQDFISEAAKSCGVSERTIYRWLDEPETIKKLYRETLANLTGKTQTELFKTPEAV